MNIYDRIRSSRKKLFAVLIDPDKCPEDSLVELTRIAGKAEVDFLFVGGSLLAQDNLEPCIRTLKASSDIPVILFPGGILQVDRQADAILLLSLISGRNPDLLIGQHVIAAPFLKNSGLEILSTGYMLIESGNNTTARYISNTQPIPHDKDDIAVFTAMAGEMLGLKMIYMDAGSGASIPVSLSMVKKVCEKISIPLIIGGGIRTADEAIERCKAGADIIVVGNAIEKDPGLIHEISRGIHSV
jgi:phosphoglycerol geranylgeranyltransferase